MNLSNAYVAGLIDGEGCVHLCASKQTYRGRVTVGMTKPALPLLRQLKSQWGGSLAKSRAATDRWQEAWTWTVTGREARILLQSLGPMLQIKRRQAELVLEVERLRSELPRRPNGSAAWNTGVRTRCSQIKEELHRLNAKGPTTATPAVVQLGRRIATWNPARGVWETDRTSLLCGHLVPFSETWPAAGMTRCGVAYPLPGWVPATNGSGSSSWPLLPTPQAREGDGSSRSMSAATAARRMAAGKRNLDDAVALLPTPTARDGSGRGYPGPNYEAATGRPLDETILSLFYCPPPEPPMEPRADPTSEAPAET